MSLNKKTIEALRLAALSGPNSLDRYNMSVDKLVGCSFGLSLDQLVDKEQDDKDYLKILVNRNVDVDSDRYQAVVYELREVKFCLGLFALAYNSPDLFDVTDDMSANDIYLQLLEKREKLPKAARDKFDDAQRTMDKAGIFLSRVGSTIKAADKVVRTVGVSAFHALGKVGKSAARGLGSLLTKVGNN